MEQYIREGKVIFPDPQTERVVIWQNKAELLAAIEQSDVPLRPKNKTPLITADLPDLDFWIGKPVGFGRPWFKRHLADLQSEVRPVSSWIRGASEDENLDQLLVGLISQRSGTGEHSVNEILGFNAFPYPKPLSLIKNLLQQAARPGDIVLDFFAGSGTTGQAVLELNAEDDGGRRFILCSSTEATAKEPQKNLCRDVCAERIRRVMQGYGNKAGLGGSFAYLQLDKIEAADVLFDATPEHAAQLLSLQYNRAALVGISLQAFNNKASGVRPIAFDGQVAVLLLPTPDEAALAELLAWPAARLVVYSPRPETVRQLCEDAGRPVVSYSLHDALLRGQQTKGNKA